MDNGEWTTKRVPIAQGLSDKEGKERRREPKLTDKLDVVGKCGKEKKASHGRTVTDGRQGLAKAIFCGPIEDECLIGGMSCISF